jgi:23S rRNA pseudouridine1911/1915/1917 synthase
MGASGLRVIYEDNHIICAVKPPGVLSQSDGAGSPDMLSLLKAYIKEKYGKRGDVYLGLVHRLDRPVGGVMAFARTTKAAGRLSEQIRRRSVLKTYYAVLDGVPPEASGKLEHRLVKDRLANLVKVSDVSDTDAADKEYASLEYSIVAQTLLDETRMPGKAAAMGKFELTLVRIGLITGRSHQIRAQFAYTGHPIVGDRKYGADRLRPLCQSPALWAASLEFSHPVTHAPIRVSAAPPDEFPWDAFAGCGRIYDIERKE